MKILLTGGRVLRPDRTFLDDCPILIQDGIIAAVGSTCKGVKADHTMDVRGLTVIPGLVDVHTHGRAGCDFCTADPEQMHMMKLDYARRGVTSVFATLASDTVEGWKRSIRDIQACGFDGIHFEGRYLNVKKRGAHAEHFIAEPCAEELESLLREVHIPCHISAAFELDADGSFAEVARRYGATMGLGHTMATAEQTRACMARGVTSFTHLYNAMPPLHHREAGPVGVAFCEGGYGELIADGLHICPDMVALAYRCLGTERTVLITDSMEGTGCADGTYSIAGQPVILKDGRAVTLDGALAGSTLNLWDGVKNLMSFAGADLADAVACATQNPARMVGIDDRVGSIAAGKRADLLLIDPELELQAVICNGMLMEEGAV